MNLLLVIAVWDIDATISQAHGLLWVVSFVILEHSLPLCLD